MVWEADLGPARRRRLAEIFAMSSRLEGAFWEMAYTLDQWPDPGWARNHWSPGDRLQRRPMLPHEP